MTVLDMLIVLGLIFGLWQGFKNGLLRSVVGMFGWLLALIFASYLAKPLSPFFISVTHSATLSIVAAFIAIALFVIVGLQLVLWVMSKTLQGLKLNFIDQLAGAVFGCGKNLVIILLALSLVAPLISQRSVWQQSKFAVALLPFAPFATQISKDIALTVGRTTADSMGQLAN